MKKLIALILLGLCSCAFNYNLRETVWFGGECASRVIRSYYGRESCEWDRQEITRNLPAVLGRTLWFCEEIK